MADTRCLSITLRHDIFLSRKTKGPEIALQPCVADRSGENGPCLRITIFDYA